MLDCSVVGRLGRGCEMTSQLILARSLIETRVTRLSLGFHLKEDDLNY